MQFLKTLFWVILAVVLVLFAHANWNVVTVNLWGGLQADVKLPVLVIFAFLLGFVPTLLIYRARLWTLKRRLETQGQVHVAVVVLADLGDAGEVLRYLVEEGLVVRQGDRWVRADDGAPDSGIPEARGADEKRD